jgi:hypothetical protein
MALDVSDLNLKLDRATRLWRELTDPQIAGPLAFPVPLREERTASHSRWYVDQSLVPRPELAGVLGDLLHNYRSCLDHAVAAVRRAEGLGDSSASSWPNYQNNSKGRATADRALDGLPQPAKDMIRDHQIWGPSDFGESLQKLSDLDNTNKHRRLVTAIVSPRTLGTSNLAIVDVIWHRVRIEKDALLVEHPLNVGSGSPQVTAEVGIDEPTIARGHLHVADLVWQVDFAVRSAISDMLRAYDPQVSAPFTGPVGPSG